MKKLFTILTFFIVFSLPTIFADGALNAPCVPPLDSGCTPADGATDVSLSPLLDWDDISGAETYEIRTVSIKKSDTCDTISDALWIEEDTHPTQSTFQLSGLSPNNKYCWKVKAEAQGDESAWSAKRSFTTAVFAPPVGPVPGPPPAVPPANLNPVSSQTLGELANKILNFLFALSLVLVPLLIVYAALLLVFAGGDPKKIERGRTILMWTIFAFVLILLAKAIPNVLRNIF